MELTLCRVIGTKGKISGQILLMWIIMLPLHAGCQSHNIQCMIEELELDISDLRWVN